MPGSAPPQTLLHKILHKLAMRIVPTILDAFAAFLTHS